MKIISWPILSCDMHALSKDACVHVRVSLPVVTVSNGSSMTLTFLEGEVAIQTETKQYNCHKRRRNRSKSFIRYFFFFLFQVSLYHTFGFESYFYIHIIFHPVNLPFDRKYEKSLKFTIIYANILPTNIWK